MTTLTRSRIPRTSPRPAICSICLRIAPKAAKPVMPNQCPTRHTDHTACLSSYRPMAVLLLCTIKSPLVSLQTRFLSIFSPSENLPIKKLRSRLRTRTVHSQIGHMVGKCWLHGCFLNTNKVEPCWTPKACRHSNKLLWAQGKTF